MLFFAAASDRIIAKLSQKSLDNLVVILGHYFSGSSSTLVAASNTLATSFFSM